MELDQPSDKTNRRAAFFEEWKRQFAMLRLEDQEAIEHNALGPEADRLEASVKAAIEIAVAEKNLSAGAEN
jgi:hypothetical protein